MNRLLHRGWSLLPFPLRKALKTLRSGTASSSRAVDDQAAAVPQVGKVNFGDLRRTTPFCANYGYSRGNPVDRYYIEGFLARHAADVHGRVLEVGDHTYTRRFGGSRVTDSDVLHMRNAVQTQARRSSIGIISMTIIGRSIAWKFWRTHEPHLTYLA